VPHLVVVYSSGGGSPVCWPRTMGRGRGGRAPADVALDVKGRDGGDSHVMHLVRFTPRAPEALPHHQAMPRLLWPTSLSHLRAGLCAVRPAGGPHSAGSAAPAEWTGRESRERRRWRRGRDVGAGGGALGFSPRTLASQARSPFPLLTISDIYLSSLLVEPTYFVA
jgi:hypothetical protein